MILYLNNRQQLKNSDFSTRNKFLTEFSKKIHFCKFSYDFLFNSCNRYTVYSGMGEREWWIKIQIDSKLFIYNFL
jgi:hypothetical protein